MYQSSVLIDVHTASLSVELQLPPSRLGEAVGRTITQDSLPSQSPNLLRYIEANFVILDGREHRWPATVVSPLQWQTIDGSPYLVLTLAFQPPKQAEVRHFVVADRVITSALPSHSILVSIRSDWDGSVFASEPQLIGILSGDQQTFDIELEHGSWTRGFGSVFRLGLHHIAEGTDHLLFLLTLLLPAPLSYLQKRWAAPVSVRRSLASVVRIATAFTIGHSITLALASFGLVHVPEPPIEVLIAVSIFVSAVHAMRPLFPGKESVVAASFGLIHGLAFATTLAELGLRGWERAESILAFNLGIETMQLVVIAFVLPSLLLLSRTTAYTPFRWLCAAFAGLASLGWIVERVSGKFLVVDRLVNVFATHALLVAATLLSVSSVAFVVSKLRNTNDSTPKPRPSRV